MVYICSKGVALRVRSSHEGGGSAYCLHQHHNADPVTMAFEAMLMLMLMYMLRIAHLTTYKRRFFTTVNLPLTPCRLDPPPPPPAHHPSHRPHNPQHPRRPMRPTLQYQNQHSLPDHPHHRPRRRSTCPYQQRRRDKPPKRRSKRPQHRNPKLRNVEDVAIMSNMRYLSGEVEEREEEKRHSRSEVRQERVTCLRGGRGVVVVVVGVEGEARRPGWGRRG